MPKQKYAGIDAFRIIASLLVVAIHVGPFSHWNTNLDFLITYCAGRIGVPFFLMVTGYFIISGFSKPGGTRRILIMVRQLAILYTGVTILYLPVIFYSKGVSGNLLEIGKAIFFDGTFYHLWYFPGVMIGSLLVTGLVHLPRLWKHESSVRFALLIGGILYIIGVFGDSWYGAVYKYPFFQNMYDGLSFFSSYTRNGIFFTPFFLILGAGLYHYPIRWSDKQIKTGLVVSFLCMLLEGELTFLAEWQKHNSMYLCLPFVMVFLFELLLRVKGAMTGKVRDISTWIYLLHPLSIIGIRGVAGLLGIKRIIVDNKFIFYLMVCISTFAASWMLIFFITRFKVWKKEVHRR